MFLFVPNSARRKLQVLTEFSRTCRALVSRKEDHLKFHKVSGYRGRERKATRSITTSHMIFIRTTLIVATTTLAMARIGCPPTRHRPSNKDLPIQITMLQPWRQVTVARQSPLESMPYGSWIILSFSGCRAWVHTKGVYMQQHATLRSRFFLSFIFWEGSAS